MHVARQRNLGKRLAIGDVHRHAVAGGRRLPPTEPQLVTFDVVHRSEQRALVVDEGYRRAPERQAGHEVVTAVDRVDVPGPRAGERGALLADDAVARTGLP